MEQTASVDVFERDEKNLYLVVQPPTSIKSVENHLAAQADEVRVFAPQTAGDLGVELLNGKTIEDVLRGAAYVVNTFRAVKSAETDIQL